jgi:hypothetical protein
MLDRGELRGLKAGKNYRISKAHLEEKLGTDLEPEPVVA